jgi:hypothetical protein
MRNIISILIIILSIQNMVFPQVQSNEPKPTFKVSYFGGFPYSVKDSTYLFVMDAEICNMTDSLVDFFCYSCSIADNILLESNHLRVARFDCAFNKVRHIRLSPGQELTTAFILIARKEFFKNNKNIRIGFVYIGENDIRSGDYISVLKKMKEKKEKIVWSNEFDLILGLGQAIELK